MNMSWPSIALRIFTGLGIVGIVGWTGFSGFSPYVIPVMGMAFTIVFVVGKLASWRRALAGGQIGAAVRGLPITFLIQTILVALIYLVGLGLGALFAPGREIQAFATGDLLWPVIVVLGGSALGLIIFLLEKPTARVNSTDNELGDEPADVIVEAAIVTPETFYVGIHYTHGTYTDAANGEGSREYDGTPNENSAGSEEKILAAEARLKVRLPDALRGLYLVQNGGSVANLCVAKPGVSNPQTFEDVMMPFGGYDDLYPTEMLRTVFDAICDYADPTESEEFPEQSEKLIILAQWYRETLFLDYRAGDVPSVGFADFDDAGWRERQFFWASFDTFWGELRLYRYAQ
jgi:hypothetical protein